MLFVFDTTALLFVLWLFVVIVDEVMEYLLNKKALACMCLIYKRYLCYVQNVVWISNLHAILVQS